MTIAFDARSIAEEPGGIGIHLVQILDRLLRDGHKVQLLSPQPKLHWKPAAAVSSQVNLAVIPEPSLSNPHLQKLVWEEELVPRSLRSLQPNVYHAINNRGAPETTLPTLLTIHDIIPLLFPLDPIYFNYRRLSYGLSIHRATAIICVSKHTRQDVTHHFPAATAKAQVIYNGTSEFNLSVPNPFRPYQPYIAYIGGFGQRKNAELLIKAFATIRQQHPEFHLLAAGSPVNAYNNVTKLVSRLNLKKAVILPGYLPHHQLGSLLRDAFCSIYPSQYEGFGLPVVESMSAGCPVIAASNSSLPEIVGSGGLLIPTNNKEAIIDAFHQLLYDEKLRSNLTKRGREQAKKFNWETMYQATLATYTRLTQLHQPATKQSSDD